MKRFSLLMTLMLMSICLFAQITYQTVSNIPYRTHAKGYAAERCVLDIYYPEADGLYPVVVWFHSGGLEGGQKELPEELKNSGLVVIGVNYRLMPKCTIDDCIDDAAAAVAWAFAHATEYHGDANKLVVAGHSAGGFLTDMIGLDKSWLAKYNVDADRIALLAPFSGQCITHFNVRKQQGIGALQPTIDRYAPLYFMRADAAPILIISGDRELEMNGRYEEQAYFWRMLKLVGHPQVFLYEMQGYDHGQMNHPAFHILKNYIKEICK